MNVLYVNHNDLNTDSRGRRCVDFLRSAFDVKIYSSNNRSRFSSRVLRVIEYIYFNFSFFFYIIRNHRNYDRIYLADIYCTIFPVSLLRGKIKSKICYDSYELMLPFDDYNSHFRTAVVVLLEKRVIRSARVNICASRERALIMLGYYKLNRVPIVIRNLYVGQVELRNKLYKIKSQMVILYIGSLGRNRGLRRFIDTFKNIAGVQLRIVGGGPEYDGILEKIEREGIGNVSVEGSYEYSDLPKYMASADIGFLHYPNVGLNNIFCAPNKISEYAYYSLPVITNQNPGLEAIVNEWKIGVASDDYLRAFDIIKNNMQMFIDNCYQYSVHNISDNDRNRLIEGIES